MKNKIILIIVLIGIAAFLVVRFVPIPQSIELSSWAVKTRINDITRKYGNPVCRSQLLTLDEADWLVEKNNYNRRLSEMTSNNRILRVFYYGNGSDCGEPKEIYAMFENFLYLKERRQQYNISAISYSQVSGYWGDGYDTLITITMSDFEDLFSKVGIKNNSNQVIAKEMASIWISANHYNRHRLILDEYTEYRENLITPWNNYIPSVDENFKLTYSYGSNTVRIEKKLTYSSSTIVGFREIKNMSIDETGYMYAHWGENNSIWLLGESTGLTVYEFDGNEDWIEKVQFSEDEIPMPIKLVMETT